MDEKVTVEAAPAAHRIRSVAIVGGFLDGMEIELDLGLNCLIGPRGAGKTTVLEIVRYAFGLLPEDVAARKRVLELVQKNMDGGRIRVTVETRENLKYIVSRRGEEPPVVLDSNGNPTDIALNGNGFFGVDIFSQNEVECIADNPASQLQLLDSFEAERINALRVEMERVLASLEGNARECEEAQKSIGGLSDELATLDGIEARLKELRSGGEGDGAQIDAAHERKAQRDRESRAIKAAGEFLGSYASEVEALSGRIALRTDSIFDKDALSGENGEILAAAREAVGRCGTEVDRHIHAILEMLRSTGEEIAQRKSALDKVHATQDQAFEALLEQHKEAMSISTERSKLEKRRNELLAKKKTHEESAAVLADLNRQRRDQLERLDKLRQERFDIRKGIADRITGQVGPTVVVEVLQCGNVDAYQDLLESSLKSAAVQHKQVAAKLAGRVTPSDFTDAIRRCDADILVDRGELNRDQARKVIDALAGTPALYDFETVEMGDQPSIRLRDGDEYKDSLSLSTGQKCTCILPILLLDSDKPLLVDQPEDNLDNRFVFDTVVKRIREVKQSRQLIFITHNPNIPVLGMAERVFVLSSNGSHAEVQHSGPVDKCRDQIVTLLEGGQEAFMERKNRYGF